MLAGAARCILFVRGIDDDYLVREIFARSELGPELQRFIEHVAPRMATLDRRMRQQWELALLAPQSTHLKRIVAECGVSRRTMERLFARCRLPSPGRVLAMAGMSHELDRADAKSDPGAGGQRQARQREIESNDRFRARRF